jgi:hypothetical protein
MISISLNQTESEKRLHRILYFVKYLRAMILNFILTVPAIALYMTFGITGLYPGAEDTVNALRAQMDRPEQYGGQLNPIVITGTVLFLIAFFVWLYLSITRVKRKSVKVLAIFTLCVVSYGFLSPLRLFFLATTILTRYLRSSSEYLWRFMCGGIPMFLLESGKYPHRQI